MSNAPQSIFEYDVQVSLPDIAPYKQGNAGTDYLYTFDSGISGPTVVITALVHGNEPSGAIVLDQLLRLNVRPKRGRLTLIFANADAYARFDPKNPRSARWVDEDLNRLWSDDILNGTRNSSELRRARQIRPYIEQADYLLDLHSTQHPNEPLILAGPLGRSAEFAQFIGGVDLVVVDRGHKQGPRMRDYHAFGQDSCHNTAILLEAGQHWSSISPDVAMAVVVRFLTRLQIVDDARLPDTLRVPDKPGRFVEITDPITIKREFSFALPLRGGEIIEHAGTVIGYDGEEAVITPYDNCVVVMPSQRLWAGLTAARLGRFMRPPVPQVDFSSLRITGE